MEERKAAAASLQGLRPSDLEAFWGASDLEPGMTYFPFLHEERFRTPESSNSQFWFAFCCWVRASDLFFLDFGRGAPGPRVLVQAALLRALPGALEKLGLGAPPERLLGGSWGKLGKVGNNSGLC